jgi:hypothetical protein
VVHTSTQKVLQHRPMYVCFFERIFAGRKGSRSEYTAREDLRMSNAIRRPPRPKSMRRICRGTQPLADLVPMPETSKLSILTTTTNCLSKQNMRNSHPAIFLDLRNTSFAQMHDSFGTATSPGMTKQRPTIDHPTTCKRRPQFDDFRTRIYSQGHLMP